MTTDPPGMPLEPTRDQLARMIDQARDRILDYIDGLEDDPAVQLDPDGGAARARSLRTPLPVEPALFERLLDELFERRIPCGFHTAGPGYLAFIPGGGLPHSAVAELIANATNRYAGVFAAAPGLVALECDVIRWFCEILGYPEGAFGFLTTGGSLANLSAIVTARSSRLGDDFARGAIYTSDQVHHSVIKAARIAGILQGRVRRIESDATFRLRADALTEAIQSDREAGLQPFLIVASAGTTNTGAVDDLDQIANIAAREGLWLHVDAAYGGPFALTARGRKILCGIERADSITMDPHKGLFLPYGTGCLLVRDAGELRRAHSQTGEYMPPMQRDPDLVDFCEISPELSRDFRGLRVWLPLRLCGVKAFERALDEKLDLTLLAERELRKVEGIEIVAPPQLTVVAFRLRDESLDPEAEDALNRRLLDAVNRRANVFLTATTLRGRFVIRICVLSFRTHEDRVRQAVRDVAEEVANLRQAG